jgi:hypothetical protein
MKLGELIEALNGKSSARESRTVVNGVNSGPRLAQLPRIWSFAEDAASAAKAPGQQCGGGPSALPGSAASVHPQGKCVVEADQPRLWFARAAKLLAPAARRRSASLGGRRHKCEARRASPSAPARWSARTQASAREPHRGGSGDRRGRAHRRRTAASIPAPSFIREPRWAIASSFTPARCWARMALATCATRRPAPIRSFRNRERC